jgi:hypothetical protein
MKYLISSNSFGEINSSIHVDIMILELTKLSTEKFKGLPEFMHQASS